jgi:DNA-binding MarR family transcriptional regulator
MIAAVNHHGRGFGPPFGLWLILGGILLVVVVISLILYFRRRQPDGLSRSERRELGPTQTEILAMLRQNGGLVAQSEMGDTVPMDSDEIADALRELEDRGLVQREWDSEKQTYMVSTK